MNADGIQIQHFQQGNMTEGTDGRRVVQASEILDKIQNGEPVEYYNVIIEDDLDLSKLDLPNEEHIALTEPQINVHKLPSECKTVSSLLTITNSKFDGSVIFKDCLFQEPIDFKDNAFNSKADFSRSMFGKYADFSGAAFNGPVGFSDATFNHYPHFEGATFNENAFFSRVKFRAGANFENSIFDGLVDFRYSEFGKEPLANFHNVRFNSITYFSGVVFSRGGGFGSVTFNGSAFFDKAMFNRNTDFMEATFNGSAIFNEATFNEDAIFWYSTFRNVASFRKTIFKGNVYFRNAIFGCFGNAVGDVFNGLADFGGSQFNADILTFYGTKFQKASTQEEACRRAKKVLAKAGNRDEEEYHFYQEMEAKRIQRGIRGNNGLSLVDYLKTKTRPFRWYSWRSLWRCFWYDGIEWFFIQGIFGYGVHPKRLMISWGAIVSAFSLVYWYGKGITGATGLIDCIKVSFAIAIAPGYIAAIINPGTTGYQIPSEFYQLVAMAETIVGTFLWAGFIATFAKKYMR